MDWKNANEGPKWVPVINQVELALDLPKNLLARMAFQESSFRADIIDGTHCSPAGALGILQLEPEYFPSANVPIPFSDDSVKTQIIRSGQYLLSLYRRFNSWPDALEAYNWGPGNEDKYLDHRAIMPTETSDYVKEVTADVPVPGQTGVSV
jgi:soluble lytic murein transglycosylase-like protein